MNRWCPTLWPWLTDGPKHPGEMPPNWFTLLALLVLLGMLAFVVVEMTETPARARLKRMHRLQFRH